MAVLSAALHKAVVSVWNTYGLEWEFKKNWVASDRTEFPALHDGAAGPSQPFPYTVFEQSLGTVVTRMVGHDTTEKHEIHDVEWAFRVYTRQIAGVGKSAKRIAIDLAEHVTMRYGGHPTAKPKSLSMDQGDVLLVQYVNDFGVRLGDEEHMWQINYLCRLDVPVAA